MYLIANTCLHNCIRYEDRIFSERHVILDALHQWTIETFEILTMKISSILAVILTLKNHRISMAFASSVHIFSSENESVLRKGSLGAPQLSVFC